MKKIITAVSLAVFSVSTLCSCGANNKESVPDVSLVTSAVQTSAPETIISEPSEPKVVPDTYQIQSICNLATLKCYFHNTAKGIKKAGTGLSHIGEKDTPFWFEYTAQATLGIDGSQVRMTIDGNDIYVRMPHAKILCNITVDPDSTSEPIFRPNSWYRNDVEITAADITNSMSQANEDIRNQISSDTNLLNSAEKRAKDLIENYIKQIMELSGVDYKIHWETIDDKPAVTETETSEELKSSKDKKQ